MANDAFLLSFANRFSTFLTSFRMTGYRFRTYATDRQQKHNFRITKRAETQKFQLFPAFSITPCLRYLHTRIPNRHIQRYACANRVVYAICGLQQHAIALREIRQPACVLLRCLIVNAEIISAAGYRHRKRTDRLTVSQKTVKRLALHVLRQIHIPAIAADRMRTDISHLSQCRIRYRSRLRIIRTFRRLLYFSLGVELDENR